VMWAGYPSEMEIAQLGGKRNIHVIADAAHALGATYFGKPIGGLSLFYNDTTCFSFQSIKAISSGDGGAICTLKHSVYENARRLRWFGIDRETDKPSELGERQYNLYQLGFKCHLSDFNSALGLGNLFGFKGRLARRREIAQRYFAELANVPGLTLMQYKTDRESAYWLFPIRVQKRADFVAQLKSFGVPTSVVHQRIDRHRLFGGLRDDLPGMDIFDREQIHIPIHDTLTDGDERLCRIRQSFVP
jgi:perosamine synthetase